MCTALTTVLGSTVSQNESRSRLLFPTATPSPIVAMIVTVHPPVCHRREDGGLRSSQLLVLVLELCGGDDSGTNRIVLGVEAA